MSADTPLAWPRLKGCSNTVAEPIPPVNEHDDRAAVRPLIADHRSIIDQVRSELELDPSTIKASMKIYGSYALS
jgi:hypothetical protein